MCSLCCFTSDMANERVTSTFRLEYGCLPQCVFCDKKTHFQFLMEQYWTNIRRWHSGYIIKFDTAKRSRRIKRFTYRFTEVFLFLETADRSSLGRCDNIIVINLYNWNCLPFFKLLSCVASEHLAGATTGYNLISS